jgi:ABC-2 type transport system permease protein
LRFRGSWRRIRSVAGKEYRQVILDPGFLFLTIVSPAVILTLLAYVFSFDVEHIDIAVMDQDRTPTAQEYIRTLTSGGDVSIVAEVGSYEEGVALLQSGDADAMLTIPPGFGADFVGGKVATAQTVADGSDPFTANTVINSLTARTQTYSDRAIGLSAPPFDVRMRVWFNPNLRSQHSMIPGLMSLVLIMPAMAITIALAREKEVGTFEMLVTTPINGPEYLLGKLVVYISLGLVSMLLALGVAIFGFGVPFRGSLLLYALLTADYLLATMAFSLIVAHFVPTQRTAITITLLTIFIPSFFLTGLIIPVDTASLSSQLLAFALPSTHYIEISRGIALKGLSMAQLWPQTATLFMMGIGGVLISTILFHKKVAR